MKKRILYIIATLVLLSIEVLIAMFVHDSFIRPYVGDMLVVIVIYTFIRIWIPEGCRLLPLYVFLFAVLVEVLQYFNIVDVLGLSGSRFFSILIGGTFDWKDIACYGAGCVVPFIYEVVLGKNHFNKKK
ncbi:MAG: DUF2809 domain-containing protein [Lachnospiraceae bacterium]|nr:DUF2809 domain-containing protein [Lachnospiraceae bacterium]